MSTILNSGQNCPLTETVLCGHADSVRRLLAAGANANTRERGIPLLTFAVLKDDIATARALLEAGADARSIALPDVPARLSHSQPLRLQQLGTPYIRYGLRLDALSLVHASPLRVAHSTAMVQLLKQHGARLGQQSNRRLLEGSAPTDFVAALLEEENAALLTPSTRDALAQPMLLAAAEGEAQRLQLMLRAGGKPNVMREQRRTPLHEAATPEVVRVLLAHGACLNAPDDDYYTPLGSACSPEVAAELRAHGAQRLHLRPVQLPELHEAVRLNAFTTVAALLRAGVNINERSEYGTTALFHSTGRQMTTLLLQHGADPHAVDAFGNNALPFAPSKHVLCLLLKAMGLPQETAQPPLPPFYPRYRVVKYHGDFQPCGIIPRAEALPPFAEAPQPPLSVTLRKKAGRCLTPRLSPEEALPLAVLRGESEKLRRLLAAGETPNTGHSIPPLMLAVLRDDVPSARVLLEAGADPNARCCGERTKPGFMFAMSLLPTLGREYRPYGTSYDGAALFHARPLSFAASASMARLLLEHGASPHGINNYFVAKGSAPDELKALLPPQKATED